MSVVRRLVRNTPVTVSLGEQGDGPCSWIDCTVDHTLNYVAVLAPRAALGARLRERLARAEVGYIVFEHNRATLAWKGMAKLGAGGETLEFLIQESESGSFVSPEAELPQTGEPLLRLMYVSRAAPGLGERDFHAILAEARRRNADAAVTGALCLREGFFGQILEGPEPAVRRTFESIAHDERHREPVVLGEEAAAHRLYGGWSMKGIHGLNEITAADELSARLAMARRNDAAEFTRRWLGLLDAESAPSWRGEWLSAKQSVLMMRQLIEDTAPPVSAG